MHQLEIPTSVTQHRLSHWVIYAQSAEDTSWLACGVATVTSTSAKAAAIKYLQASVPPNSAAAQLISLARLRLCLSLLSAKALH